MIGFLGQMTTEGVATGAAGAVILTVATLLIRRGFHVDVGKGGNGDAKRDVCPLHDEFSRKLDERNTVVNKKLDEIHDSQSRLHDRLDELIKGK